MIVDECRERKLVVAERVAAAACGVVAVIHADGLLEKVEYFQPEVFLIDLDAPGRDSPESLRSARAAHARRW